MNAIEGAARSVHALRAFRTLYTSEVVNAAQTHGIRVTHDYQNVPGAIPLPATLSLLLAEKLGESQSDLETRLYSKFPFPWRQTTGGLQDEFGKEAWVTLNKNPEIPFYRFTDVLGHWSLRYAVADVMRPSCVNCHNLHEDSPKQDWAVGDVRGVLEVILPMDHAIARTWGALKDTVALISVLAILGLGVVILVIKVFRYKEVALFQAKEVLLEDIDRREQVEHRLVQQTEQLVQSNQELTMFANVAAHDLQEPLRKIQLLSDRVQGKYGEALGEQGQDYLSRIQRSSNRMQELVKDALIYSKIKVIDQKCVVVDLGNLVEEILVELEREIESTQTTISVGMLPTVQANPIQMRQLFHHLLSNALKYQKSDVLSIVKILGHPIQKISEAQEVSGSEMQYWEIVVEDNGIGFDEQYTDRMFGLFQQLNSRKEYQGTGAGLAICKKIVELHQGSIMAQGSSGGGARFTVRLPVMNSM